MESIEKLRELAADINGTEIIAHIDLGSRLAFHSEWLDSWHKAFDAACEEIEREIAERYMELPLDADGVPIHCGERMRLDNGHEGEVWLIGAFDIMMSDHMCFDWAMSHHAKPRTLEDVLKEVMTETRLAVNPNHWIVEKYAAEIRELLGVGA